MSILAAIVKQLKEDRDEVANSILSGRAVTDYAAYRYHLGQYQALERQIQRTLDLAKTFDEDFDDDEQL